MSTEASAASLCVLTLHDEIVPWRMHIAQRTEQLARQLPCARQAPKLVLRDLLERTTKLVDNHCRHDVLPLLLRPLLRILLLGRARRTRHPSIALLPVRPKHVCTRAARPVALLARIRRFLGGRLGIRETVEGAEAQLVLRNALGKSLPVEVDRDVAQECLLRKQQNAG